MCVRSFRLSLIEEDFEEEEDEPYIEDYDDEDSDGLGAVSLVRWKQRVLIPWYGVELLNQQTKLQKISILSHARPWPFLFPFVSHSHQHATPPVS